MIFTVENTDLLTAMAWAFSLAFAATFGVGVAAAMLSLLTKSGKSKEAE